MAQHKWTIEENILAYYLYRIKDDKSHYEKMFKAVVKYMRPGYDDKTTLENSLIKRVSNFQYLDGKTGALNRYAQMSKDVYDEYSKKKHRRSRASVSQNFNE